MIKIRGGPLHVMVLLPLYVRAIQPKPPEGAERLRFLFDLVKKNKL